MAYLCYQKNIYSLYHVFKCSTIHLGSTNSLISFHISLSLFTLRHTELLDMFKTLQIGSHFRVFIFVVACEQNTLPPNFTFKIVTSERSFVTHLHTVPSLFSVPVIFSSCFPIQNYFTYLFSYFIVCFFFQLSSIM